MTSPTVALRNELCKLGLSLDGDSLREMVRVMSQMLMELEVEEQVGAERYERTTERTTQRNGYRDREWDTRVGTVPLRIPKVRSGSYFPS